MANLVKSHFVLQVHFHISSVTGSCVTNVHVSTLFQKTSSLLQALHVYDYVMEQSVKKIKRQIKNKARDGACADIG